MIGFLLESGILIVNILFGVFAFIILLRFLFQCARVNFYNPISQFLLSVTNPFLIPLRRVIPGFFGLDIPALILLFVVTYIKMFLLLMLTGIAKEFNPTLIIIMAIWSITEIAYAIVNIYLWSLIILIVFSWLMAFGIVNPYNQNPIISVIEQLMSPLTKRARKIIPATAGLDLSPFLIFMVIGIIQIAFRHLPNYAKAPWGIF